MPELLAHPASVETEDLFGRNTGKKWAVFPMSLCHLGQWETIQRSQIAAAA